MDKYINQLFITLSQKYKVNIITIMSYSPKYKKVLKNHTLRLENKKDINDIHKFETRNKRDLINEMIKWLN